MASHLDFLHFALTTTPQWQLLNSLTFFPYEGSYFFIVANPFSSSVEPSNKNTRYLDRK